jgi:Pyruvate/2-oxoacid:ferredoxin oxidoreductase delta subunit
MASLLDARRLRVVLYEGPGSRPLPLEIRKELVAGLLSDGHAVTRPAPSGPVSLVDESDHIVLGDFGGAPPSLQAPRTHVIDLAALDAASARTAVGRAVGEENAQMPGAWKPWFPVIDYDRCTHCLQCLTFCLFDVYGLAGESRINVAHQDHCKTDCPACSRVCPEAAIMFPKYKKGPINGDVVREEDLQRESMKVDISALLGGDIYAALKERSAGARQRFSTERDESKALLERKRCLKKMAETLDIPDEVLMTLPSAGDIEERARRAREKAARRQQASQSIQDRRPATEGEWGI